MNEDLYERRCNNVHILSCRTKELMLRCRKTCEKAATRSGEFAAKMRDWPSDPHRMQSYSGFDKRKCSCKRVQDLIRACLRAKSASRRTLLMKGVGLSTRSSPPPSVRGGDPLLDEDDVSPGRVLRLGEMDRDPTGGFDMGTLGPKGFAS